MKFGVYAESIIREDLKVNWIRKVKEKEFKQEAWDSGLSNQPDGSRVLYRDVEGQESNTFGEKNQDQQLEFYEGSIF